MIIPRKVLEDLLTMLIRKHVLENPFHQRKLREESSNVGRKN